MLRLWRGCLDDLLLLGLLYWPTVVLRPSISWNLMSWAWLRESWSVSLSPRVILLASWLASSSDLLDVYRTSSLRLSLLLWNLHSHSFNLKGHNRLGNSAVER